MNKPSKEAQLRYYRYVRDYVLPSIPEEEKKKFIAKRKLKKEAM